MKEFGNRKASMAQVVCQNTNCDAYPYYVDVPSAAREEALLHERDNDCHETVVVHFDPINLLSKAEAREATKFIGKPFLREGVTA